MEAEFDGLLDVTKDDLEKLDGICRLVSSKYIGKPQDIAIFSQLKHELEYRCAEAGFIVEVAPKSVTLPNGASVWVPECSITGRVDAVEFDPEKTAAEGGGLIL